MESLRLDVPRPFAAGELLAFLDAHVVPGVEACRGRTFASTVALPGGPGVVELTIGPDHVDYRREVSDPADAEIADAAVRRLLDLDVDPLAVDAALAADPLLAPLVARTPGLRVPGTIDAAATAVRTVVGQQISVAGAATVLGRMAAEHGEPCELALAREWGLDRLFPTAEALAGVDPERLPMPRARGATVVRLAAAIATGDVRFDVDPVEVRRSLTELRGIGPWTADYVRMRGLGDPDVLLTTDLVLRRALEARGLTASAADRWRPWRSYAGMHLWLADVPALAPGEDAR